MARKNNSNEILDLFDRLSVHQPSRRCSQRYAMRGKGAYLYNKSFGLCLVAQASVVAWHQDTLYISANFIPVADNSATVWIALTMQVAPQRMARM